MRVITLLMALLPLLASATINIVQSNDDGWADVTIRTLYHALFTEGFNSFIAAPADDQSGTGDATAGSWRDIFFNREDCQYDACPDDWSHHKGHDPLEPTLNYIRKYPVDAIEWGIENLAPKFFGGAWPDLAVIGPNLGNNLGYWTTRYSGTVGAAVKAAKMGVPAIAFSGHWSTHVPWNADPVPLEATISAELAIYIIKTLIDDGKPYLPDGTWLNVNFPDFHLDNDGQDSCTSIEDFSFVFTRATNSFFWTDDDIHVCGGQDHLPIEEDVVEDRGCKVSITVEDLDKHTADRRQQVDPYLRFRHMLDCRDPKDYVREGEDLIPSRRRSRSTRVKK